MILSPSSSVESATISCWLLVWVAFVVSGFGYLSPSRGYSIIVSRRCIETQKQNQVQVKCVVVVDYDKHLTLVNEGDTIACELSGVNEQKDTHEMAIFEKYRVTLEIVNSRKAIKEMVRVVRIGFGCIDVGLNSHENQVTSKQSPKWQFVVTSIDQRDVVWLELESGYASWNLGHLQQKAEIKLKAKIVLDLVSNVSSMDMLRPKLTKLLLKVTAQRSLGSVQFSLQSLEPDERLIDLVWRLKNRCVYNEPHA
ncbi:hypothetical protein Tco_0353576 [Tanacetum coccineum]